MTYEFIDEPGVMLSLGVHKFPELGSDLQRQHAFVARSVTSGPKV
jgi:hypothetical protein